MDGYERGTRIEDERHGLERALDYGFAGGRGLRGVRPPR
jgi:hypothetical protein